MYTEQPFVPYTQGIEQIQPGEADTLRELDERFVHVQRHVVEKEGVARRATHAKPTGLLKGRLVVGENLPAELAQGMFAQRGKEYEVLVRLSQGPSEYLSDKASGQRGFSIKVLGVEGARVSGSIETTTQDWVFGVHDTSFTDATAKDFLSGFKKVAGLSTWMPEAAIIAGSRIARVTEDVLETVSSGSAHLRFFGKKPAHPLSDRYFSQAAVRYGCYVGKLGAYPSDETLALIGSPDVDTKDDDVYQHVLRAFLSEHEAVFHIRVQLCTDLKTMPIEDAAAVWPEENNPYRTVAQLILPKQDPMTPERIAYFEERLAFNPVHSLEEHRALGSIMRARAHVYLRTQEFRQKTNKVAPAEPRSLSEVPD